MVLILRTLNIHANSVDLKDFWSRINTPSTMINDIKYLKETLQRKSSSFFMSHRCCANIVKLMES